MTQSQQQQLITALFDSHQFRFLLKDFVLKTTQQDLGDKNPENTTTPSNLLQQISDNLHSIIHFNIKHSLNQEYTFIYESSSKLQKEVQELKQIVWKLTLPSNQEAIAYKNKSERTTTEESTEKQTKELEFLEDEPKEETINREIAEFSKIKKEIDSLKNNIEKLNNNVECQNQEINKRIQEKYSQIEYLNLEKSMSSIVDIKCDTLEAKVQNLNQICHKLLKKCEGYEPEFNRKLETNFKSVWNVITNLQSSISQLHKNPEPVKQTKKGFSYLWK